MISGLPPAFPTAECSRVEDLFRTQSLVNPADAGKAGSGTSAEETWVRQELDYYQASYTTIEDLNVCVTTFNVASKKPSAPLNYLATLTSAADPAKPIDLVVLAYQEVDMSATAMFREETEAATPWVQGGRAAIGADSAPNNSTTSYYAFPPKQLVGLLLCVYIRRALLPQVREYSIATVATGALGSMGNKGAVGLHLVLYRTSICVITAHLAAGQDSVSKRNEDINTILQSMDFNATRRAEMQLNVSAGVSPEVECPELFPRDHDIVIVTGDLNYRLNLSYTRAVELAAAGDIAGLLQYDQFALELQNKHTPWQGFVDCTPTFLPTYRYDIGTSTYDTSEKRRVPSYTDRVCIWVKRRSMESRVCVDSLKALGDVLLSDHKPVQAVLRLPVCVEVATEKEKVVEALRSKVARVGLDRASSCKTTVDLGSMDFGVQQFYHSGNACRATITNTGECVAVVQTVRQLQKDETEAAWLRTTALHFAVLPGESREVVVEARIDPHCMPWLRKWRPFEGHGRLALSSMLWLCVRSGSVHVIQCTATLLPSIFGNQLENVVLLGETPCSEAYQRKGDLPELLRTLRPQVPKELWVMADVIARHPREPELFFFSGDETDCTAIMEFLDTRSEPLPPDADVHCVAECLLVFLKNLQEPVVPYSLYAGALAAGRAKGKAPLTFLKQLPILNANVLIYLLSLMNFLLRPTSAQANGLTAAVLAQVFSAVLIVRPLSRGLNAGLGVQGGGMDQQLRQRLQEEKQDAISFIEFFLVTPPELLQL